MIKEEQISDFVKWAKKHDIVFRGAEVRRANKANPTKTWQLLFCLFLDSE